MNAEQLRAIMEKRKLSKGDLAQLLDVSERCVYKWLSGERAITPTTAMLLRIIEIRSDWRKIFTVAKEPLAQAGV